MKPGNVSETNWACWEAEGQLSKGSQERPPGPGDISVELWEGSGSQPVGEARSSECGWTMKAMQSRNHLKSIPHDLTEPHFPQSERWEGWTSWLLSPAQCSLWPQQVLRKRWGPTWVSKKDPQNISEVVETSANKSKTGVWAFPLMRLDQKGHGLNVTARACDKGS